MNEFVNFKKRGITLPPGCKDLIDLLQRSSSRPVIEGASRLTATRNETVTGKLPDVGKYVRIAFESGGAIFTLGITRPGGRLEFALLRVKGGEPWASIAFPSEREEERVVREFFTRSNSLARVREASFCGATSQQRSGGRGLLRRVCL